MSNPRRDPSFVRGSRRGIAGDMVLQQFQRTTLERERRRYLADIERRQELYRQTGEWNPLHDASSAAVTDASLFIVDENATIYPQSWAADNLPTSGYVGTFAPPREDLRELMNSLNEVPVEPQTPPATPARGTFDHMDLIDMMASLRSNDLLPPTIPSTFRVPIQMREEQAQTETLREMVSTTPSFGWGDRVEISWEHFANTEIGERREVTNAAGSADTGRRLYGISSNYMTLPEDLATHLRMSIGMPAELIGAPVEPAPWDEALRVVTALNREHSSAYSRFQRNLANAPGNRELIMEGFRELSRIREQLDRELNRVYDLWRGEMGEEAEDAL